MRFLVLALLFFVMTSTAVVAEVGKASFYTQKDPGGGKTASGETYNEKALTAAHRKLPFNTLVKVVNLETGASVLVRINDRGPFVKGRVIDLSKAAFKRIASHKKGVVRVKLEVIGRTTEGRKVDGPTLVENEVKAWVARQYDLPRRKVTPDTILGEEYKAVVLYCASRFRCNPRDFGQVSKETTVGQLAKAITNDA